MLKICKHDFKPHEFIKCINDDCGNTYYLYQLQCMKCGKKPIFKAKKSREKLELFDFKMESLVTVKNSGVPCILYNNYNLMRGQMLIVKEMVAQNVVGGLMYDMEMQLVEIRGKHIILQDSKGTSTLTGGVAEYCFSIDEIGKTIFPK